MTNNRTKIIVSRSMKTSIYFRKIVSRTTKQTKSKIKRKIHIPSLSINSSVSFSIFLAACESGETSTIVAEKL